MARNHLPDRYRICHQITTSFSLSENDTLDHPGYLHSVSQFLISSQSFSVIQTGIILL